MPTPRTMTAARAALPALMLIGALLGGCGARPPGAIPSSLLRTVRPIGVGPRFQPPAAGPIIGRCRHELGARTPVHLEVFAAGRVVIIPAGIGTRPPRVRLAGRITRARCYGDLVTLEPTGVILTRAGQALTLSDLFRSWGQPLTARRLAGFAARPGRQVTAYVAGTLRPGPPGRIPLTPHAEIVVEVGPHVPPHHSFTFASSARRGVLAVGDERT
jgi:hypothetical protein